MSTPQLEILLYFHCLLPDVILNLHVHVTEASGFDFEIFPFLNECLNIEVTICSVFPQTRSLGCFSFELSITQFSIKFS